MTRAFLLFRLGVAVMLLLALGRWPYSYYVVLRVVTTVAAVELFVTARERAKNAWLIPAAAIAVLWNPLFGPNYTRETWHVLDVLAAVVLLVSLRYVRESDQVFVGAPTD